jgi:hypothetical protein
MQVEQAAVELEGDEADGSATYVALKNLLMAKGVVTPQVRDVANWQSARRTSSVLFPLQLSQLPCAKQLCAEVFMQLLQGGLER